MELRKHSWQQGEVGKGQKLLPTRDGDLNSRRSPQVKTLMQNIFFLTDKTICCMVENYRRSSFMLVSMIRRLSRTLGLTWAQSGDFPLKILVQTLCWLLTAIGFSTSLKCLRTKHALNPVTVLQGMISY